MLKKILVFLTFFISFYHYGQTISPNGTLFANEIHLQQKNIIQIPQQYYWQQMYDYGYAEVFIRIPEKARFTVRLGEQELTTSNGFYRFFDIPTLEQELSFWYNGFMIYKVRLFPKNNSRMVFDFFSQKGLFLLQEIDLRNAHLVYGTQWNQLWNAPIVANSIEVMNDNEFDDFLREYRRNPFDDNKIEFFRTQKNIVGFTIPQISEMIKLLVFPDRKLTLVKEAYELCPDKKIYYQLSKHFEFSAYKNNFISFLKEQNKR